MPDVLRSYKALPVQLMLSPSEDRKVRALRVTRHYKKVYIAWRKTATSVLLIKFINKRAQRALGRSPEEKVKGQGKAIYRGPLMLSTKYW